MLTTWIRLAVVSFSLLLLGVTLSIEEKRATNAKVEAIAYESALEANNSLVWVIEQLKRVASNQTSLCNNDSLVELNNIIYESPYVRWIAIYSEHQKRCETNTRNWLLDKTFTPIKHYILPMVFLTTINQHGDTDTFVGLEVGDSVVVADVELIKASIKGCLDCMQYEFALRSLPPLTVNGDTIMEGKGKDYELSDVQAQFIKSIRIKVKQSVVTLKGYDQRFKLSAVLSTGVVLLLIWYLYRRNIILIFKIKRATKQGEFIPYYQPIVDVRQNRVVGAEVLMRWQTSKGIVSPNAFIPHAEKTGLIISMTEEMMKYTARHIKHYKWDVSGLVFSVNIVPAHLINDDFYHFITRLCQFYHIAPTTFAVEITERRAIVTPHLAHNALLKLKALGVGIKLDDMGVGYSSLSYLMDYPIDTIKLDKSFVDEIRNDVPKKLKVMNAIIELAKNLDMSLIAEGVESHEQVKYLCDRGVYKIQGYYFSKPISAVHFAEKLNTKNNVERINDTPST